MFETDVCRNGEHAFSHSPCRGVHASTTGDLLAKTVFCCGVETAILKL